MPGELEDRGDGEGTAPRVRRGGRVPRGWELVAWIAVVVIATVAPLVVSVRVFPQGSPDRDDAAYLSQADAIRHGHLTLPADSHQPLLRPFLSGVHDGKVIFKYQPVWPAILAFSDLVTGSTRAALGATGLAATLAVAALAFEVSRRRRAALLAAAVFACSPWFAIQAGTYLAYPLSAAFAAGATALVLRGVRLERRLPVVLAGALFGAAAFHRPYDAVLAGAPVLVWLVASRGRTRLLARDLGLLAAGALPFAVAMLGYDLAVTGSPFTLPFSLAGPLDRFGFGLRSSFDTLHARVPGQPAPYDFTPGESLRTIVAFTGVLPDWLPGGLLVLIPAWFGLRRAAYRRGARLVLAQGLAFPIGYSIWWGAANARAYSLHLLIGPIYWFPLLVTAAVLAGAGLDHLIANRTWTMPRVPSGAVAFGAVCALVLASLVTFGDTRTGLGNAVRAQDTEVASLRVPTTRRSVVIAPRQYPGDRYVPVPVPARIGDALHLVALDPTGGWRTFDVVDHFGDRATYRVVELHGAGHPFDPGVRVPERLVVRHGTRLQVPVAMLADHATVSVAGKVRDLPVRKGRATVTISAQPGGGALVVPPGGPHQLAVSIGGAELWWLVRVDPRHPDQVQLIDPALPIRRYEFPGHPEATVVEDVSAVLHPA